MVGGMADASQPGPRAFSESELRLLDRLNAMSQREFAEWFRGMFEPSIHSVRVVTACNHILGRRLAQDAAAKPPQVLGASARWT